MTTSIAVHPAIQLRRGRLPAGSLTAGTEAAVPDISLASPGAQDLGDFAREHALELTRFAYLVSADRNRAEDLVQDVLLAMHRRFGDQLRIEQPLAYARRAIVTATALDRPVRDAEPGSAEDLWQLVAGLPHRQRVVLVMRYHLGYTDAEIAETLGCRRGTVRSLASRALADLRASNELAVPNSDASDTPRDERTDR
jgi:DNA-directed RNA polymerase specialized sigma24 family protein